MSVDVFDVLACYRDLWETKSEKRNAIRQGIISTDGCMENCIKLRINAGDKSTSNAQDKAIADVYRNKLIIPLDFEMLDSAAPYYQAGLGNRLCYELTFNDYNRVTKSGVSSPKVPEEIWKGGFWCIFNNVVNISNPGLRSLCNLVIIIRIHDLLLML